MCRPLMERFCCVLTAGQKKNKKEWVGKVGHECVCRCGVQVLCMAWQGMGGLKDLDLFKIYICICMRMQG